MDALSDALSLLKPRTHVSAGLHAGGDWALSFPPHEGIKFNAVVEGRCHVQVENDLPCELAAGDCFLLTTGRPFVLATDLALPLTSSHTIYDRAEDGIALCNGGGDFVLVGARFAFEASHANTLLGCLPPVVVVRGLSEQASVLRWALDLFTTEMRQSQPGSVLITDHLAQIMLVQVLRLYLAQRRDGHVGWLYALSDPQLGRSIGAMHTEPEKRWTVAALARLAGMSRSVFALRFRQSVGMSPMDYLTQWRMLLASSLLRATTSGISEIARSAGYECENSFAIAFRRSLGCTPRQYRHRDGSN
ncbi:AraC family transcriptional regulator [Gluconobacter oxydans]|uniref:AraC family transcriptional regulator n=1 Tax=Gluconobacter thailandicus TaxID=257438 RepID=UPI0002999EA4|nr:AraC family transcriptional regulator [Gluconobacter thailandicus]AFW02876.1 AraC family transcriptional regulator [Gluconobacter oxydans H24]ANQ41703.1 AraC family transcriptional regulator [Gluconobacter oxydans]